ncbi:MAG TPA: AIPR family protein [Gaiellaceae bacterium]|nr:AIPR family protein [Gaiellaceae bacterium]
MENTSDKHLGIVRHQFDVPVRALENLKIYSGANPRKNPKVRSRVAKQIRQSLLNEDTVVDAFHLAHLGITVIATDFTRVEGREDAYLLKFKLDESDEPQDGIVNGLHTLAVIEDLLGSQAEISPNQYVSFTVITGIAGADRATIVPFIAKGRNTVLQVKEESIDNLMKRFDTIKKAVDPFPYENQIGWEESANTEYDVIDVLAIMTALNPILYPNETSGTADVTHPIIAADHKRACLKRFEESQAAYDQLAPLLPDMLHLYDLVRSDARERYNTTGKGKRGGRLRVMTSRKDRKTGNAITDALYFPFYRTGKNSYGTRGTFELTYSATFAILAAFRNFIVLNESGQYEWKGGFAAVEKAWRKLGAELVITCQETAETLPEHKMAVLLGRNRPLWNGLHKIVREYLTRQDADERTAELQAEINRLKKLTETATGGAA